MEYTHAETAWLVNLPVVAIVVVAILLISALAMTKSGRLAAYVLDWRRSAIAKRRMITPELVYHADDVHPGVLTAAAWSAMVIGAAIGSLSANAVVAVAAGVLLTGVVLIGVMYVSERRYVQRLDAMLTQAVGRLATQMRSGQGFTVAMELIISDLEESPLKREWSWLLRTIGAPTSSGLATESAVCDALARQTPSQRHAAFLLHLASALQASHQERTRMIEAAYHGMVTAQQRMSLLNAELSQMRNSGVVLFLANAVILVYLGLVQTSRLITAYSSPYGAIVGTVLAIVVLAPLIGGWLLGQYDDVLY